MSKKNKEKFLEKLDPSVKDSELLPHIQALLELLDEVEVKVAEIDGKLKILEDKSK